MRIDRRYRVQELDLAPGGATVAVTTDSDNPFEQNDDALIFTQANEGMAGPDKGQISVRKRKRPQAPRTQPGKVRARAVIAPAYGARAGFMPGMGADPVAGSTPIPTVSPWATILSTGISTAGQLVGAKYTAQQQAAMAQQAQAQSEIEASRLEQSRLAATMSAMGQHKAISIPLLVVGGAALLIAGYLFMKKRK